MSATANTIDHKELEALIGRVEHAIEHDLTVEASDLQLLLQAIQTLIVLQSSIEDKDITLHKLRKLLNIVASSEKRGSATGRASKKPKKKPKPPAEREVQTVEHHAMQDMQKGDVCPQCSTGKLYSYDPAVFLRITGFSPMHTSKHIVERLRCNACGQLFTAPVSDEVKADGEPSQMYGYSARAIIAINKYFAATPFYRNENVQTMFGTPITASTQYDQCKAIADIAQPIYEALKAQAAQSHHIFVDDTHNQILQAVPIEKPNRNKKGSKLRTGVYSSALLAIDDDVKIMLYETSIGHAGEFADDVLRRRTLDKPPPNYMCDASANNSVSICKVQNSLCNAHARRYFFDIEKQFSEEVAWVLDQYKLIWINDTASEKLEHTPAQRLEYHQKHSKPVMQAIHQWCETMLNDSTSEHYSGLGKAQKYFVKHYKGLIGFCTYAGAAIDNNITEQALKLLISNRKNSYFYKTEEGAKTAHILISILATCHQNKINAFQYLVWVQQHRREIQVDPTAYLPWHFKQADSQ
jgi:transposase